MGQEIRKGLTRAETVIKQLEELGWAYEFRQGGDARITELICIPDVSKKFLECFPEVLIMDCTYKTNRYKLPLLDIVGQTNTNSTFYAGFGLLAAEDEVHHSRAIRSMRTLLGEKLAEKIKVVVSDREKALINALEIALPGASNIICIWHANKAVLGWLKRNLPAAEEEKMALWNALANLKDVEEFNAREELPDLGLGDIDFANYLQSTWLIYKKKLVAAWVDQKEHFGHRASSRAEGAHSRVKKNLGTSTGDLTKLVDVWVNLVEETRSEYVTEAARQALQVYFQLGRDVLFSNVVRKITPYALKKVSNHELRIATY